MDNYNFLSKTQYRRRVWNEIEKVCTVPKALRRVAYLDTRDALETIFLLERGYQADNLLAINRAPVEVALLTRRLKQAGLPTVQTAGVEWAQAIGANGPRHIVNFDGTGCLHKSLLKLLRMTIEKARPGVIAVNLLGGREQINERSYLSSHQQMRRQSPRDGLPNRTSFGNRVNPNHAERVRTVLKLATDICASECHIHVTSIAWDVYRSESRQPMVWCVATLKPHRDRDVSWWRVEKNWCLSPACVYLRDPSTYRYAMVRRLYLETRLFPTNGGEETPQEAASRLGITVDDLRLELDAYDHWRDRVDQLNTRNPIAVELGMGSDSGR